MNLLVYAVNQDSRLHERAKAWLEDALSGTETVGLAWNVLLGFLRVTTRSAVMMRPLSVDQALEFVGILLAQPAVAIIEPGKRHFELLGRLLSMLGTAGNLTSDAHIAALAIEQDAEVYSADFDFARFTGVRWRNPLAKE